jgi:peptidoglycan/LPS O-acetylase OafA/YrhL
VPAAPASGLAGKSPFRPDIQGLRAIAVMAVVLFHVWPHALPGGYVGVDVFFVISGFLITALLVRELEQTGAISFRDFYSRRLRRLMPASVAVLATVLVLTPFFLPAVMWKGTAIEAIASSLYVENWWLARIAVDYLGAEEAASPLQHFWSLSIEEQFYLVWPALIAGLAWVARRFRLSLIWTLRLVVMATVGVSLYFSVSLTATDPAKAYFVTQSRVWALALGAALALLPSRLPARFDVLVGVVGLACIVAACVMFSAETAFPGYAALLPTLGAVMVIAGGIGGVPAGAGRLLSIKPFRWLGDASYSIYLWHWPIVVFYLAESETSRIGPVAGTLLILATLSAAWFSKVHIEDRFRQHNRLGTSSGIWRMGVLLLIPVMLGSALLLFVRSEEAEASRRASAFLGAQVLRMSNVPQESEAYVPSLGALKADRAEAYTNGCHLGFEDVVPVPCRYGDPEGGTKVFLVGDSHAVNWIPALEKVARERGWNATSFTKSSCPVIPIMVKRAGGPYKECLEWGERVRAAIRQERPDIVIFGQMYSAQAWAEEGAKRPSIRGALVDQWRDLMSTGARVVIIADTPRWRRQSPDACLSKDRWCSVPVKSVRVSDRDPLLAARKRERRVGVVDMTDVVCPEGRCPAVIGNVVVWRDRHHLTATFSRSAAEIFGEKLDRAIQRDEDK